MNFVINFTNQPTQQQLDLLCDGLDRHAKQTIGATSFKPFGFLVNDHFEKLIAGCTGVFMYGTLEIKLLWIDETARGKGLGRQLMEKAETFAKENQCRFITVTTFDWQAKGFYEKLGYVAEHFYDGYDGGSKYYFFRKKIM